MDLDGLQVSCFFVRARRSRGPPPEVRGRPLQHPHPLPCTPQSYFNQPQAGPSSLNDPLLMQAQAPFRNGGGLPGMPAGFAQT